MRGVIELPTLSSEPTCPAALPIAGAIPERSGVVCRVMQREHRQDAGVGMNAAQSGFIQNEAEGGVFLTLKSDPSTVVRFCHGDDVPVIDDAGGKGRDSYTYCPVWQAEVERLLAGEHSALHDEEPEQVSMGVSSMEEADPWAAARRDLDLLAPPKG